MPQQPLSQHDWPQDGWQHGVPQDCWQHGRQHGRQHRVQQQPEANRMTVKVRTEQIRRKFMAGSPLFLEVIKHSLRTMRTHCPLASEYWRQRLI